MLLYLRIGILNVFLVYDFLDNVGFLTNESHCHAYRMILPGDERGNGLNPRILCCEAANLGHFCFILRYISDRRAASGSYSS